MYKVSFFIVGADGSEIVKSSTDTNLTNILVYCGDMSWALKRSNSVFRVVVEHVTNESSSVVFSFISSVI